MTITINHNHTFQYKPCFEKIDTRLSEIHSGILSLLNKQKTMSAELDLIKAEQARTSAALAEIGVSIGNVGADILNLASQLANGITPEEAAELANEATAIGNSAVNASEALKALDAQTPDVVTEPQP
jgi:hypothetical protein